MNGAGQNLPYYGQWLGLAATLFGAGLAAGSFYCAKLAARRAKAAGDKAELARQAATRLGRIAQLGDLIADMQELQTMLARTDFPAIAGKANLLRGRIVRFKTEAYNELREEESEKLDLAREQLQTMAEYAATGKASQENKTGRLQIAYGNAYEAMNAVVAIHGQKAEGD